MSYDDDPLADRLRRALQDEAEHVSPAGDGLGRIRARIADQRFRRGWWLRSPALVLGAAAVAGIAAGTVIVAANRQPDRDLALPAATSSPGRPTETPSATPSMGSTAGAKPPSGTRTGAPPAPDAVQPPPAAGSATVTVFYPGDAGGPGGLRLYREQHRLQFADPRAVIRNAVTAMLIAEPRDPDYRSYWPAGLKVRGIKPDGDAFIVDLPGQAATRSASAEETRMSVQQLVYTVTQAAQRPAAGVRLRLDGREITELWGHPLGSQPLRRAAQSDVLAPVWITSPGNNETVGRTFTMKGEASVFEANVSWEIRSAAGVGLRSGFATASAGGPARGTWSVPVTLPRGKYELRAFETSAQDGTPLSTDTKAVVVR